MENSAVHTEKPDSYFLLNIHYLIKIRKTNKGIGQLWEYGNKINFFKKRLLYYWLSVSLEW